VWDIGACKSCPYYYWELNTVGMLDSGASSPGLCPGRGHCIVFLGKKLYSHSASLHPGVSMGTGEINGGG